MHGTTVKKKKKLQKIQFFCDVIVCRVKLPTFWRIFMAKQPKKSCRSTLNMKAQRNIPHGLNVQEHRCESLQARNSLGQSDLTL